MKIKKLFVVGATVLVMAGGCEMSVGTPAGFATWLMLSWRNV